MQNFDKPCQMVSSGCKLLAKWLSPLCCSWMDGKVRKGVFVREAKLLSLPYEVSPSQIKHTLLVQDSAWFPQQLCSTPLWKENTKSNVKMPLKWNKPTPKTNKKPKTRGIYSTFQTRGSAKTGQMSPAYQISKLHEVQTLFKNFVYEQAFPERVRLPVDLKC